MKTKIFCSYGGFTNEFGNLTSNLWKHIDTCSLLMTARRDFGILINKIFIMPREKAWRSKKEKLQAKESHHQKLETNYLKV